MSIAGIDYAAMAAMTESMIAANGRLIMLLASNTTASDAAKPWRGVTKPYTKPDDAGSEIGPVYGLEVAYAERDIDGDKVKRGDKKFLVAALNIVDVKLYEGIDDGGDVWSIVAAELLQPGPTRLLYTFQVRQ